MKCNILVLFLILFMIACKEKTTGDSSENTISKGQMPALTTDKTGNIHMVFGYGDSIMYTFSKDNGISFSPPVLVDTLIDLIDYATRGPQIAPIDNGIAIIAVNKSGNIYAYAKDPSGNWMKPIKVNDADTTNKEGFLGLSSDGNHKLFAIWPDLRNDAKNKIYGAQSADGGKTWGSNILVYTSPDSSVCECCKPSVIMDGDKVHVMFRNWLDGNRDLYFIQSDNAGETFGAAQKLGNGNWPIDGCPMDGGGLTLKSKTVETIWRRRDSIFSSIPGQDEQFIAIGKGCSIAAKESNTVYTWTNDGKVFWKINNNAPQQIGTGNLPVTLISDHQTIVCAWTDNDAIKYRVLQL